MDGRDVATLVGLEQKEAPEDGEQTGGEETK